MKKQNSTPEQEKINLRINTNKFKVLPIRNAANESMFMVTTARKTSIDITKNLEPDEECAESSCEETVSGVSEEHEEGKKKYYRSI